MDVLDQPGQPRDVFGLNEICLRGLGVRRWLEEGLSRVRLVRLENLDSDPQPIKQANDLDLCGWSITLSVSLQLLDGWMTNELEGEHGLDDNGWQVQRRLRYEFVIL